MDRQVIFAIVVGAIMIFSVMGFAVSGLRFTGNVASAPEYPVINNELLSSQDKSFIVRQGKVLIEFIYDLDCEDCTSTNSELEMFVKRYSNYIVLESVATNETNLHKFQMIGNGGRIIKLEKGIGQEDLLKNFCDSAMVTPKECLLRNI